MAGEGSEEEGRGVKAELAPLQAAGELWKGAPSPPSGLTGKGGEGVEPCTCPSKLGNTHSPGPKWKVLLMVPISIRTEPQEREISSSASQTACDHDELNVLCLDLTFIC